MAKASGNHDCGSATPGTRGADHLRHLGRRCSDDDQIRYVRKIGNACIRADTVNLRVARIDETYRSSKSRRAQIAKDCPADRPIASTAANEGDRPRGKQFVEPIRAHSVAIACEQSGRRLDGNDSERMRIILIADGNVLTRDEGVRAKAVARLVIVDSVSIVVKDPAGVLLASRLMNHLTHLFILTVPETMYPAGFAMRSPECCVDMALGIERHDEFITVLVRTLRKLLRPGKVEANALEFDLVKPCESPRAG